MIRFLQRSAVLSLLALTTTFAMARPAAAGSCGVRHGGTGGSAYSTLWQAGDLAHVTVWFGTAGGFGDVVNAIEWTWCTAPFSCSSISRGNKVGTRGDFAIDWQNGEHVTFIGGSSGVYLDAIQFHTSAFRSSGWFGGSGGTGWGESAAAGQSFNDFAGSSGSIIDSIILCQS
jgi:hypothetical protein